MNCSVAEVVEDSIMYTGVVGAVIGSIPTYWQPTTPVPGFCLNNPTTRACINTFDNTTSIKVSNKQYKSFTIICSIALLSKLVR